jgi:archaellum biogenesis ATPase FlaH
MTTTYPTAGATAQTAADGVPSPASDAAVSGVLGEAAGGVPGPAADATVDAAAGPTADAAAEESIAAFWREHYLESFIAEGGSKIKFICGNEGSGKSECLQRFLSDATATGYKAVAITAKKTWLHDFQHLYSAIFEAIDFEGCLEACAEQVVLAMGYRPEEIPRSMRFADFLQNNTAFDPLTKREIRAHLSEMFFANTWLDNNFAIASALMVGGILGYPTLEPAARDSILGWFRAEKGVRIATLRKLGLSPSRITRHNARHMLRSLLEIIRLAGFTGLAVAIDDLEMLSTTSTLEDIRYTKMRREDAYESIREMVDGIDTLGHFMIVFAMDKTLLEDEAKGIKSYQALWMRIQNEIVSDRVNRFADIIDTDRMRRQALEVTS